jgi:hypothetical protein
MSKNVPFPYQKSVPAEHVMAKTPVLSHGLKKTKSPRMRTTELTHVIALSTADLSSLRPTQINKYK